MSEEHHFKSEDAEEVKEILTAIKDTVPEMIKQIVGTVYSEQNAEHFATMTAKFYKSLIDAGMDKDQAFALTKQFMDSRDITSVLKNLISSNQWHTNKHKNREEKKE